MFSTSRRLLDLVIWTDKLVDSGLMKRKRLIVPSFRRIRKLFSNAFNNDNVANDDSTLRDVDTSNHQVYLGASYNKRKKDPEHLPPQNALESFGDKIRKIPAIFKSQSSTFAFRVTCCSMSLAIIIFVRQTQKFSITNRVYWSVIMAAISMTPTSGQSVFGFILRFAGTFIAMLLAWVIYYVAGDGKAPGILVLYWFFVACIFYIPLKRPPLTMLGIITNVTITLIIGYELEAQKLGPEVLSRTGQKYFGILEFGPIRLATVAAGLFAAFIFTIFPYPISEHSSLRSDAATSLYVLANFYSIVHETVGVRIRRVEGNSEDKHSPGQQLERARMKAFNKLTLLVNNMRIYSQFTRWEGILGGKFPKENYDALIDSIRR
jgi:hypothetical protein